MLIDTHAHLHFDAYKDSVDEVLARARAAGVETMICVGVDESDSAKAVALAGKHSQLYATVGIHPHDAGRNDLDFDSLRKLIIKPKVVAVGECGLDYYKGYSEKSDQIKLLRQHIELALEFDKPLVFHVRDAFDDFFSVIDDYQGVRGIVHSFTDTRANAERAVERGLMIALNGIMTFTRSEEQLNAAKNIPLDHLVLETDCPFLAPVPMRGKQNEPAYMEHTARFLAELRGEDYLHFASRISANTNLIFKLR